MNISKKQVKALAIPSRERATGLHIHCNYCKGQPNGGDCKLKCYGKKITGKCQHTEHHRYRVRIHISGSTNKKLCKILETRKLSEAVVETIRLSNEYQNKGTIHHTLQSSEGSSLGTRIINFLDEISPENEEITNVRKVSSSRVGDYRRNFVFFTEILKKNCIDVRKILPEEVTHDMAVIIIRAVKLKQKNGYTIRNYINTYKRFFNYLRNIHGWNHKNVFSGNWNIELPKLKKETIYDNEFRLLLKTIQTGPKSGIDKQGRTIFHGFPWLQDAFRIAVFTGCRRGEIVNMKYSDVRFDEQTKKWYLIVRNTKASKLSGREKTRIIMINEDLHELLREPKHLAKRGTDIYIIAGDEHPLKRTYLADAITRAFTFYAKLSGIEKKLVFSSSRKAYATQKAIRDGIASASGELHENATTTINHYINELAYLAGTENTGRLFSEKESIKNPFLPPVPPSSNDAKIELDKVSAF